jgi:DNA repair protein RadC
LVDLIAKMNLFWRSTYLEIRQFYGGRLKNNMSKLKHLMNKLNYPIPMFTLCMVKGSKNQSKPVKIGTPMDALQLLAPLTIAAEEHFITLHLNVKHEVIGINEVAHGTLTESLIHPREVFKAALLANSFAVLVCHNHPSGALVAPSREDYITTRQLIKAGKLLGIPLVDHLILGCDLSIESIYSFREKHPDLWFEKDNPENASLEKPGSGNPNLENPSLGNSGLGNPGLGNPSLGNTKTPPPIC